MVVSAQTNPTYQPARRIIENITNARIASVTTTFAHNYLDGEIVRLIIPKEFGMFQADKLKGTITVTGNTTFDIDIDTRKFDSFITVPVNPVGVTPGPINLPGGANQLKLGHVFLVEFDVFTVDQLGAGVATTTSNPNVTASIDSTVDPNIITFTGATAGANISYFVSGAPYTLPNSLPQVIPVGEVSTQLNAATKNVSRSPR